MKKHIKLLAIPLFMLSLASCGNLNTGSTTITGEPPATTTDITPSTSNVNPTTTDVVSSTSNMNPTTGSNITSTTIPTSNSYPKEEVLPVLYFGQFENSYKYRKVSTEKEFLDAIYDSKNIYTNELINTYDNDGYVVRNNVRKNETNWNSAITKGLYLLDDDGNYNKIPENTPFDPEDTTYTASMKYYEDSPYTKVNYSQKLTKEATVNVIEITEDLDLGYNLIKNLNADSSTYENWDKSKRLEGSTDVYADSEIQKAGISKIKINNATNLLIYSKNGSKLTHCGFDVSSCFNVWFKNIKMDEIWMWEDSTSTSPTIKVGDYDSFGWAYFKVSFSEGVWIDHCTFGKSFDGQIDYSNPVYNTMGTYQKAPYGATGGNGLNITNCSFEAGSDDHDGYLYKMMEKIENEYQIYLSDKAGYNYSNKSCRYYFTLRDKGLSFDNILYGIAIPQKKAFLWGDSGDSYKYNKYLQVTLSSSKIKNIEDRLPKVRGGMAYVYNTQVDNTEYLPYVSILKGVQSQVQAANSKYKLGAVSQGILAGLDASIYLESVEYKGISSYLKNNDSSNDNYPTVNGGYMIINSNIGGIIDSTDKEYNYDPFKSLNVSTGSLSINNFAFKENGEKTDLTEPPFVIEGYDLISNETLDDYFINNPVGTSTTLSDKYLFSSHM